MQLVTWMLIGVNWILVMVNSALLVKNIRDRRLIRRDRAVLDGAIHEFAVQWETWQQEHAVKHEIVIRVEQGSEDPAIDPSQRFSPN